MKRLVSFFILALFFLVSGCADNGTNVPSTPGGSSADLGKVSLAFSNAPDNVARVVARISRDGYSDRILVLVIADSSASGSFTDVAVGTWHLRVDAEDDSGRVLYTGQTDVDVFPGQISHVSLHLQATTGGIEIEVTWGNLGSCVPPPAGLVSWWTADGNTSDHSGLNPGSLHNGAAFAGGEVGQGFRFNDLDDNFQSSTLGFPTGNANRTMELWVRQDSVIAVQALFAVYGDFSGGGNYELGASGSRVFFSQWGETIWGPFLQRGRWYHIAVTNVGNFATLYVDGNPVSSGNLAINTPGGTTFRVGTVTPSSPGYFGFRGMTDEIAVYDRALTNNEIRSIFMAGSAGKCR